MLPVQLSLVHTLGAISCRASDALQVIQYAGLAGLKQVAQELSHPVHSGYVYVYVNEIVYI